MGRSVHMNEALIFLAIVIATILQGYPGCACWWCRCLPVWLSLEAIFNDECWDYLPLKMTGPNNLLRLRKFQVPRRKWTRKERLERLGTMDESDSSEPASALISESQSEGIPVQEKTEE